MRNFGVAPETLAGQTKSTMWQVVRDCTTEKFVPAVAWMVGLLFALGAFILFVLWAAVPAALSLSAFVGGTLTPDAVPVSPSPPPSPPPAASPPPSPEPRQMPSQEQPEAALVPRVVRPSHHEERQPHHGECKRNSTTPLSDVRRVEAAARQAPAVRAIQATIVVR